MRWKPCIFKACGRVEHVGRARWNEKLGGWEVREMRPGYATPPDLYGPSAVYSITWITSESLDAAVKSAGKERAESERRQHRARIIEAITGAIDAGQTSKAGIVHEAAEAIGESIADVRAAFGEAAGSGTIVRVGRAWSIFGARSDDIPF